MTIIVEIRIDDSTVANMSVHNIEKYIEEAIRCWAGEMNSDTRPCDGLLVQAEVTDQGD